MNLSGSTALSISNMRKERTKPSQEPSRPHVALQSERHFWRRVSYSEDYYPCEVVDMDESVYETLNCDENLTEKPMTPNHPGGRQIPPKLR
jgi:hypothetical protein